MKKKWNKIILISLFIFTLCLMGSLNAMQQSLPMTTTPDIILKEQGNLSQLFLETKANNYTTNPQNSPSICKLTETTFVIVWTSDGQDGSNQGVYATIFDITGANITKEFRVNTETFDNQYEPSISRINDTTFVVIWSSYQDGSQTGVYGTIFDNTGTNLTNEFRLNNYTTGYQLFSSVSGLDDTTFVAVWASAQDGDSYGIVGSLFDTSGNNITSEFIVNTYITGWQSQPKVDRLTDTTYAVTWISDGQDGSDKGIYANVLDITGTNLTNEFRANANTTGEQSYTSVSRLTDSTFVIAWQSNETDVSGNAVVASIFDNTGSNLTNEFQVNNYTTNHQQAPTVTDLTDDTFLVAWESVGQDPTFDTGTYATVLDTTGSNVTEEFRVNSFTTDSQALPSACNLNDTNFVVTWVSAWQDLDQAGIYFRGFKHIDAPPESNSPSSNSYKANTTGNTIDWILTDDIEPGNYTVLKNDSTHAAWDSWDNNTNLQIAVDTNSGLGLWNYTIYFNDSANNFGTPHTVWITISNHTPSSNSPDDASYPKQAPFCYIEWNITDEVDTWGWYRVFRNDQLLYDWGNWNNDTNLNVVIVTADVGTWNYTIQYNDSLGDFGTNDTVVITITDTSGGGGTTTPIPGFEWVIVLFGVFTIAGLSYALKKRQLFRYEQ